ncbi:MAG: hypothetical protein ACI4LZ_01455 [Anaerovoracaceae bacterium]
MSVNSGAVLTAEGSNRTYDREIQKVEFTNYDALEDRGPDGEGGYQCAVGKVTIYVNEALASHLNYKLSSTALAATFGEAPVESEWIQGTFAPASTESLGAYFAYKEEDDGSYVSYHYDLEVIVAQAEATWPVLTDLSVNSGAVLTAEGSNRTYDREIQKVEFTNYDALEDRGPDGEGGYQCAVGKVTIYVNEALASHLNYKLSSTALAATFGEAPVESEWIQGTFAPASTESLGAYFAYKEEDDGSYVSYHYDLEVIVAQAEATWPQLKSVELKPGASLNSTTGSAEVEIIAVEYENYAELVDKGPHPEDIEFTRYSFGKITLYVGSDFKTNTGYNFNLKGEDLTYQIEENGATTEGACVISGSFASGSTSTMTEYVAYDEISLTMYCCDLEIIVGVPDGQFVLYDASSTRSNVTQASVSFKSNKAGSYYYAWADADAEAPEIDVSEEGTAMAVGENVITLSGLTSGSKKLYVKAKDESGNVSDVFVFDIPEELMYSLTLYTQTNGEVIEKVTIDGEVAEINIKSPYNNPKYTVLNIPEGSEVKVWVLPPDTTKDIDTVTLSSNSKIDGNYILFFPEIEGNTFTFIMPMYDVRTRIGTEGTYWLTLKEAEKPRVALTSTVENFANSKIKMGSVEYTVGGETVSQVYAGTEVTAEALPDTNTFLYEVEFRYWEAAEGITLSEEQKNSQTLTFTVPEGVTEVNLKPVFEKVGTTVSWSTDLPGTSIKSGSGTSETDIIKNGVTLNLQCIYDSLYHKMIGWTVIRDGVDITDSADVEKSSNGDSIYVKISGDEITITAHLEYKAAATVTASANDAAMGSAVLSDGTATQQSIMITEGQEVTLTATPNHGYQFNNWTVTDSDGNSIEVTVDAENANKAVFVMPDTGKDISAVANFSISDEVLDAAADVTDVYLTIDGQQFYANKDGTSYTITLPAGTSTENLADAALTIEHAERASVTKNGEEWASGQPCGMAADTPASFAVTSKDGTNVNEFTVTITAEKRSGNYITAVELLNEAGGASAVVSGVIDNENNTVTVTLPNDIGADFVNNIGMKYLRITSSDGATVAMTGGHDDKDNAGYSWAEGSVMCNMSLNSAAEFVVTAENGSQKTYYITIAYTVPDAPTVSNGTAERTSDSAATVKFTSSEAGKYYYAVVNSGAAAPTINTSGAGTSAVAGENTISISNLTAGARDIYIVVKGVSGVESVAYKVAIPAFSSDEGQFSITVTAPQGGTITPSKTKANAGDVITIAVTPNAGYQMVPGSLSYTIAVAGGATNAVENFTFEMPNADVTITCQWETAKEVTDGITGFSIDGVVGVVNNNTNKITITMPYGTDVTKLVPIFTTNNVASISPSPDEAIDFSEPVTFTVTLSNGSVKTYVVNVYVMAGSPAQEMWDKLADIYEKSPWWEYADHQISHAKYPKYW